MPTLFLCGDVMTGRSLDQIQACPSRRHISGEMRWRNWNASRPDARIINLETSVTTSDEFWPGKGIHYRMHPQNVDCLTAAAVDVCVLANNHVLDYGRAGLDETIATLIEAGLKITGAGASIYEVREPAIVDLSATDGFWCSRSAPRIAAFPKPGFVRYLRPGVNHDDARHTTSRMGRVPRHVYT
jgi:hypothetical protein